MTPVAAPSSPSLTTIRKQAEHLHTKLTALNGDQSLLATVSSMRADQEFITWLIDVLHTPGRLSELEQKAPRIHEKVQGLIAAVGVRVDPEIFATNADGSLVHQEDYGALMRVLHNVAHGIIGGIYQPYDKQFEPFIPAINDLMQQIAAFYTALQELPVGTDKDRVFKSVAEGTLFPFLMGAFRLGEHSGFHLIEHLIVEGPARLNDLEQAITWLDAEISRKPDRQHDAARIVHAASRCLRNCVTSHSSLQGLVDQVVVLPDGKSINDEISAQTAALHKLLEMQLTDFMVFDMEQRRAAFDQLKQDGVVTRSERKAFLEYYRENGAAIAAAERQDRAAKIASLGLHPREAAKIVSVTRSRRIPYSHVCAKVDQILVAGLPGEVATSLVCDGKLLSHSLKRFPELLSQARDRLEKLTEALDSAPAAVGIVMVSPSLLLRPPADFSEYIRLLIAVAREAKRHPIAVDFDPLNNPDLYSTTTQLNMFLKEGIPRRLAEQKLIATRALADFGFDRRFVASALARIDSDESCELMAPHIPKRLTALMEVFGDQTAMIAVISANPDVLFLDESSFTEYTREFRRLWSKAKAASGNGGAQSINLDPEGLSDAESVRGRLAQFYTDGHARQARLMRPEDIERAHQEALNGESFDGEMVVLILRDGFRRASFKGAHRLNVSTVKANTRRLNGGLAAEINNRFDAALISLMDAGVVESPEGRSKSKLQDMRVSVTAAVRKITSPAMRAYLEFLSPTNR